MTTKYEWVLKKDTPGVEKNIVGKKLEGNFNGSHQKYEFEGKNGIYSFNVTEIFMVENPEWFEKREVKPKRWRADENKNLNYYFLFSDGDLRETLDLKYSQDDKKFFSGNYFRTKEQAEEARYEIHKLLMQLHEKWGE